MRLAFNQLASRLLPSRPHYVPAVALQGTIRAGTFRDLNMVTCENLLTRAFTVRGTDTVALVIDSPGGSPVQSFLLASHIKQLATRHDKKVVAFVEDTAASGGYFLACAAHEIVATPFSIVGSIGVVNSSFGFQDLIKEHGVERRLFTSGPKKAMIDPFTELTKDASDKMHETLNDLHAHFIRFVKTSRGNKIKAVQDDVIFSGEFWTASKALELGLIDHIATPREWLDDRKGPTSYMSVYRRSMLFASM